METNSTSVTFIIHISICSDSFCIPMKTEYWNSENKQENKNTQNTYTVSPIPNLLMKGKKQTECLLPYCNLRLTHLTSIFWWYLFKIVHSKVTEERSYTTQQRPRTNRNKLFVVKSHNFLQQVHRCALGKATRKAPTPIPTPYANKTVCKVPENPNSQLAIVSTGPHNIWTLSQGSFYFLMHSQPL